MNWFHYIPSAVYFVIMVSGLIVGLSGFRRTKRKLFLFSTIFFAAGAVSSLLNAAFSLISIYSPTASPWYYQGHINFGLLVVSYAALSLMIWGLYQEARR